MDVNYVSVNFYDYKLSFKIMTVLKVNYLIIQNFCLLSKSFKVCLYEHTEVIFKVKDILTFFVGIHSKYYILDDCINYTSIWKLQTFEMYVKSLLWIFEMIRFHSYEFIKLFDNQ